METEHHLELPRGLQVEFAQKVQQMTDLRGDELTADELLAAFHEHYLAYTSPYELGSYTHSSDRGRDRRARSPSTARREEASGVGNGPIDALVDAFERRFGITIEIRDYHEHAMSASRGRDRRGVHRGGRRRRRSSGASASTRASSRRRCARWSTPSTARSPRARR